MIEYKNISDICGCRAFSCVNSDIPVSDFAFCAYLPESISEFEIMQHAPGLRYSIIDQYGNGGKLSVIITRSANELDGTNLKSDLGGGWAYSASIGENDNGTPYVSVVVPILEERVPEFDDSAEFKEELYKALVACFESMRKQSR